MKNNQNTDEITILKTRYHWKIFIFPVLVLLLAGFLYAKEWFLIWYLSYPIAVIGIIVLAWRLLKYFTNEFTVTSENVIHKYVDVFLGTHNPEKKIHLITDVHPHKPILGQIFNYGNILLNSSESKDFDFRGLSSFEKFEESVHVAREFQKGKLDAQEVRLFSQKTGKLFGNPNESTQNLNSKSNDFKSSEKVENDVKSIKVTPIYSDSERERIRSEFKAYSPPREDYKKYPLPKNGEKWKLERALPSGLILLKNKELSAKKEATSILHDLVDITKEIFTEGVFTEGTEKSVFDERPYLYDIEKFKHEFSQSDNAIQRRKTDSIAWHPVFENILITAGDGVIPRVWDIITGETKTKRVVYFTSPGDTLCWSLDGYSRIFISDEYIFGDKGEFLCKVASKWSPHYRFSSATYKELRGISINHQGNSHLSFTNNFSPWIPNSEMFVFSEYEQNLILRNGKTSQIEKSINLDITSYIKDFAWHPKRQFIAVAFEKNNIRIIDIDEAKIVADLSVRYLSGWSPNGKILVARDDLSKDDFVIWDALETEEKPMPEEMKDKLWFKRFFKNISADGLRYIKVESGIGNIYSLDSDELLTTLPKDVTSAAWSPIDGGLLATCSGSETHIWRL